MNHPNESPGAYHTRILEMLFAQNSAYHNHKETMAHAGILVEVAIIGGIVTIADWPPKWVPDISITITSRVLGLIALVFLWLLIHLYIVWQLRNRRTAAFQNRVFLQTLRKWANTPPNGDALKPYKLANSGRRNFRTLIVTLFIPPPLAILPNDINQIDYPIDLVNEWEEQRRKDTGGPLSEKIIYVASFLVLSIGVLRIASGK